MDGDQLGTAFLACDVVMTIKIEPVARINIESIALTRKGD